MFGAEKSDSNDGLWLKGYRESDWVSVAEFGMNQSNKQSIDVSRDSCYVDGGGSIFCILRSIDVAKSLVTYFACFIAPPMSDEITIIVDRTEKISNATISKDSWRNGAVSLKERTTPGISSAVQCIRNYSAFNSYSTMPPYVFLITAMRK